MGIVHHVLDPRRPVVQSVADLLLAGTEEGTPDLSACLVIVPTRQAGRRLREVLALRCADRGTGLLAPLVVPPAFLVPPPAEGGEMTAVLVDAVWARLLLDLDLAGFRGLFPVDPPEQDFDWALRTGRMLQRLRETLAEGGLAIGSVPERAGDVLEEAERWEDLLRLETLYLERLAHMRREDPCQRMLRSAEAPHVPDGVERVVITPVPDATDGMVQAFETLGRTYPVDVLLCRHEDAAAHLDAWGRPCPDYWQTVPLPIPDPGRNLQCCSHPGGQSRAVRRALAEEQDRFGPDDVAVGVPDPTVIPFLRATLEEDELALFDPAGQPARQDPVYLLLEAFGLLLEERSYVAFSRWLRQPEFLRAMERASGWNARELLEQADTFQNTLMPMGWADVLDRLEDADAGDWGALRDAVTHTREWIDAFGSMEVPEFVRTLLTDLYGGTTVNARSTAAIERVLAVLDMLQEEVWEALEFDAASRYRLFLGQLADEPIQEEWRGARIDLLGWIELAWDDAPFLIVTGMNEGCVPERAPGDAFLPDRLRTALGLRDDRARHARDAYLMHLMLASRCETGRTVWLLGRTGVEGDPLKPSRLLFHCPGAELPGRAERLFQPVVEVTGALPRGVSFPLQAAPDPSAGLPMSLPPRLHVTDFSAYLRCPYRFYLSRICRMQAQDDLKTELDALEFGSLMHDALEAWGHALLGGEASHPGKDADFLEAHLRRIVRARYGPRPALSILMQAESGVQRLRAAARVHAEHARQGWAVIAVEQRVTLARMGMEISGKIDRVDRHRDTGVLRILDYKTSETAIDPPGAHLETPREGDLPPVLVEWRQGKPRRWSNLQLPLYRLMLGETCAAAPSVEVGYFNLPRAVGDTAISLWEAFGTEQVEAAAACADGLIAQIRAGLFWPPAPRLEYDDFEALFPFPAGDCLTGSPVLREAAP